MRCNILKSCCASNHLPRFVSIHPVPPSYRPSYKIFSLHRATVFLSLLFGNSMRYRGAGKSR